MQSVINVTHRGAIGGDAKTGDGAGVITQIPRKLFGRELATLGISLPNIRDLAVGMVFLPEKTTNLTRHAVVGWSRRLADKN